MLLSAPRWLLTPSPLRGDRTQGSFVLCLATDPMRGDRRRRPQAPPCASTLSQQRWPQCRPLEGRGRAQKQSLWRPLTIITSSNLSSASFSPAAHSRPMSSFYQAHRLLRLFVQMARLLPGRALTYASNSLAWLSTLFSKRITIFLSTL